MHNEHMQGLYARIVGGRSFFNCNVNLEFLV